MINKDYGNHPMPFGKYKGKRLDELPDTYIVWLYEGRIRIHNELKEFVKDNYEAAKANVERNNKNN